MKLFNRTFAILFAALVLSFAHTAHAQTTLIDFSDVNSAPYITPGGVLVPPVSTSIAPDRYKSQGVLLSAAPYSGVFVGFWVKTGRPNAFLFAAQQADNPAHQGPVADGVIIINFVMPGTTTPGRTGSVSFRVAGTESAQTAQWTARAYNNAGALLDTQTGTADDPVSFSRPAGDISRVTFTATTQEQDTAFSGHYDAIASLTFGQIFAL